MMTTTALEVPTVTGKNGTSRWAVYSFINGVCNKRDTYGAVTFRRLVKAGNAASSYLKNLCEYMSIPGFSTQKTPTMDRDGLEALVPLLGCKVDPELAGEFMTSIGGVSRPTLSMRIGGGKPGRKCGGGVEEPAVDWRGEAVKKVLRAIRSVDERQPYGAVEDVMEHIRLGVEHVFSKRPRDPEAYPKEKRERGTVMFTVACRFFGGGHRLSDAFSVHMGRGCLPVQDKQKMSALLEESVEPPLSLVDAVAAISEGVLEGVRARERAERNGRYEFVTFGVDHCYEAVKAESDSLGQMLHERNLLGAAAFVMARKYFAEHRLTAAFMSHFDQYFFEPELFRV